MNDRRRAGALGGAAAVVAAGGSVLSRHQSGVSDLSDFWLGVVGGTAIGLLVLAILVLRRGGRRSACN